MLFWSLVFQLWKQTEREDWRRWSGTGKVGLQIPGEWPSFLGAYRMAEAGGFKPDARVELLNGEIIDVSPTGPFHGGLAKRLTRLLDKLSKARWLVSAQDPLRLGNHSEPEPDVMLLKPAADDYTSRQPQPEDVFLLMEVSDSTLDYDREDKLPACGRAGIPKSGLSTCLT